MRQPSIPPPYFWELRLHLSLACLLAQLRAHALRPPASGEGEGSREQTMLKFCQMTGPGLANAAGQAVAMHCVRGRSGVTKLAPPGPLCCILWAFSGVAPRRTDGKFTVKLLSGGGRHRSRVTFALTGGCIAVQPVSCQSTTQITALQHAPQATTNPAVFVRAAASSHPSLCSRTPPCTEAMTHTSQTPKAGHALNQIFCYGLYSCLGSTHILTVCRPLLGCWD